MVCEREPCWKPKLACSSVNEGEGGEERGTPLKGCGAGHYPVEC